MTTSSLYPGFNVTSFRQMQDMTVGAINGLPTDDRWREETAVFTDIIVPRLKELHYTIRLEGIDYALDYGCGGGRLTKAVMDAYPEIKIIAVDQSENMLSQAKTYCAEHVRSGRVTFITPAELDASDKKFQFGWCVYVLQHVPAWDLRATCKRIGEKCERLLFVNSLSRMAVPEFKNDGADDLKEILKYYPTACNAIPAQYLIDNWVIRQIFLTGGIRHYAFILSKKI
jgi:SAM-dependent methyltransferase